MLVKYSQFLDRLSRVQEAIAEACGMSGRLAETVRLLPVTKTHPVDAVRYAVDAGLPAVGENRVQEAAAKQDDRPELPVRWELIGHLQSNKARLAVECFDRVQSVDSVKLLEKLGRHATELGKTLPILLQFNAGDDPAKFGESVESADAFLEAALKQEGLRVEGLMTIAPLDEDREVARRCFARLREVRDRLETAFGLKLPELSMGMSGDIAEAIAEGSTCVRVGTALFGDRPKPV